MEPMRELFPIAVLQDGYGGAYSRGAWLAIGCADKVENGAYRIIRCMEGGAHGDDSEAGTFWSDPPSWIAVGNTPEDAVQNLRQRPAA